MTTAHTEVRRERTIATDRGRVWSHVADADAIVDLMESLRSSQPLGDGRYRWTMRAYGALGYRVVPEADLHIVWHEPERVVFTPVGEAAERARAGGELRLEASAADRTDVTIAADIAIELPIPRLLAAGAASLLSRELRAGFDRFLDRLAEAATS